MKKRLQGYLIWALWVVTVLFLIIKLSFKDGLVKISNAIVLDSATGLIYFGAITILLTILYCKQQRK